MRGSPRSFPHSIPLTPNDVFPPEHRLFRPKPRNPRSVLGRESKEILVMSYVQKDRDFEPPAAEVGRFFKDMFGYWREFKWDHLCSYDNGNRRKPGLVLGCGNKDFFLDLQTVLLLQEALRKEPDLLDQAIAWALANATTEANIPMATPSIKVPAKRTRRKGNNPTLAAPKVQDKGLDKAKPNARGKRAMPHLGPKIAGECQTSDEDSCPGIHDWIDDVPFT